jgi:DNA helicase HerA-like ATPase
MPSLSQLRRAAGTDVKLRLVSVEVLDGGGVLERREAFAAPTARLLRGLRSYDGPVVLTVNVSREGCRVMLGIPGPQDFAALTVQDAWTGVRVRPAAGGSTDSLQFGATISTPTVREPECNIFESCGSLALEIDDDRSCTAFLVLKPCKPEQAEHILGLPQKRRDVLAASTTGALNTRASAAVALEHAEGVLNDDPWLAHLGAIGNDRGLLESVTAMLVSAVSDSAGAEAPAVAYYGPGEDVDMPEIIVGTSAASVLASPPVSDRLDLPTVPAIETGYPLAREGGMVLGRLTVAGRPTKARFAINAEEIRRHVFVSGSSGSGKTTFVVALCRELFDKGVPITVIEPAKSEYADRLRTQVSPDAIRRIGPDDLSFNPLAFPEETDFDTHRDDLRSILGSSLDIPPPGDFVLERMIDYAYREFGWTSGEEPPEVRAFPTLKTVYGMLDATVDRLGYGREVSGNVKGAVAVRLRPLVTGRKGRMFAGEGPAAEVVGNSDGITVIELDHVRHPDEKAFVMGMLLIGLREVCLARGEAEQLAHVTVIEEAHHVLAQPQGGGSDARARGLEGFANALAEVRAYGEGLVVADQSPAKLIRDVVRNTATKISFRTLDPADQELLAGSLNLPTHVGRALAGLATGEALCGQGGAARPARVRMIESVPRSGQ